MTERHTNLDTVRGAAVLGMFLMNAVYFGLGIRAYFDVTQGNVFWFDWIIGGLVRIFADQKFMAIYSMLFGASIAIFTERAEADGCTPLQASLLSLWSNILLLIVGVIHLWFFLGDVLTMFALSAPLLIAFRKASGRVYILLGTFTFLCSVPIILAGDYILADALSAGASREAIREIIGLTIIVDDFARSLGMILLGVGLYTSGLLTNVTYMMYQRGRAILGLFIGIPLVGSGLSWMVFGDIDHFLLANIPNTLATIPMALSYVVLLSWIDERFSESKLVRNLRAVGRMALTNYLMQTVLGLLVFSILGVVITSRSEVILTVALVWALQIVISRLWLKKYEFGPLELVLRALTYGRLPGDEDEVEAEAAS